jgi:hypothetical protein
MTHHNYSTLMEPAEIRVEKILQPTPIWNDTNTADGFCAISKLKDRLQRQYEAAYPGLAEIISHVIDQEEANARNLSSLFPHLVLPGLVEIHMSQVRLEPPWMQPAFRTVPFCFIEPSPAPVFG